MQWESFLLARSIDLFIWILTLHLSKLSKTHINYRTSQKILQLFINSFKVLNFVLEIIQQKQPLMFPTEFKFIQVQIMKKLMMT